MSEFKLWISELSQFRLPRWDMLPEIELYMDQVLELVEQYLVQLLPAHEKVITSTMINNYVKKRILRAPMKKKYTKEHISHIIVITILKQVLSLADVEKGIRLQTSRHGSDQAYDLFCQELEHALQIMSTCYLESGSTCSISSAEDKHDRIVQFATLSFATKIITEKALPKNEVLMEFE